jgi:hypothetical protein
MARINKSTPTGRWGKDKEYSASVNSGSFRIENGRALPELRSVTLTLTADDEKELYVTLTRKELSEAWEFLQKCEEKERQNLSLLRLRAERNGA